MSGGARILNRQTIVNPIANPADPQAAIAGPGKYTVQIIAGHFDGMYYADIRTPAGVYVETHRFRSPQDLKAWVEKYVYQGQHGMYDVLPRLQWKEGKSSGVRYTTSFTVKKRASNPPYRRRGSSSGYSSLPPAYTPRFVPRHLMAELSNLWHLSRVPHQGRYERMLWTSREFHKEHPELSETGIYKDLSASLEGWV